MLLSIKDLRTYYRTEEGIHQAVDGLSLVIAENETVGLVGESGCGKSTLAKSILGLLPPNARVVGGSIEFEGEDLVTVGEERMRQIRWSGISLIPQSAMNALNPVATLAAQIKEAIDAHEVVTKDEAIERAQHLFKVVGLHEDRIFDYPHQLSGGMRQRAVIAMALALKPKLIIADEPTTALDVMMQKQIMTEIHSLQKDFKTSILWITHDISVVMELCQKVGIMYAGQMMEFGELEAVFERSGHPYTVGLKKAFPDVHDLDKKLVSIPGRPPNLVDPPRGCRFASRCFMAREYCHEVVPKAEFMEEGHYAACHFTDEIPAFGDPPVEEEGA